MTASKLYQLYWPTCFLFAWALIAGGDLTPWLFLNLASWPIAFALSVIAHEAGHALMGAAVGFVPFRARLGLGPLLKEVRFGPTRIELRHLPMGGMVFASTPTLFAIRARMWLLYAGGPTMTLALLWLAYSRTGLDVRALASGAAPWELLGFVNAILLIVSLYPGHINGMATDGRTLLLRIPWVPVAQFEVMLITQQLDRASVALSNYDFAGARELSGQAMARLPSSEHVTLLRGVIELMEGNVAKAKELFAELLGHPEPQVAALSRNNLAWSAFLERKSEALEEALAFSEAAEQTLPRSGAVQGTRGAVLYWAGRDVEARERLQSAFETNEQPHLKALNACVLSMLCVRTGDRAEAAEWLSRAHALDTRCPLLEEARGISASASTPG